MSLLSDNSDTFTAKLVIYTLKSRGGHTLHEICHLQDIVQLHAPTQTNTDTNKGDRVDHKLQTHLKELA